MRILTARPLDAELFRPFGTLVEPEGLPGMPVNEGRGRRIDLATTLPHDPAAATPALSIYELEASSWPVQVGEMERHRFSGQLFLFLSGQAFLVAVAHPGPDGDPDPATLQAFTGRPGQAIVYDRGIWHLPMVALQHPGRFAMMMWETGKAEDCDTFRMEQVCQVQAATA